MGLSSTTDKQKEAAWRVEFKALGEQLVFEKVKQGAIYNHEAKRFSSVTRQCTLPSGVTMPRTIHAIAVCGFDGWETLRLFSAEFLHAGLGLRPGPWHCSPPSRS
jgi:hypothetical protein